MIVLHGRIRYIESMKRKWPNEQSLLHYIFEKNKIHMLGLAHDGLVGGQFHGTATPACDAMHCDGKM